MFPLQGAAKQSIPKKYLTFFGNGLEFRNEILQIYHCTIDVHSYISSF